jgi:hypothetical protein
MRISEMTDIICRTPFPIRILIDRLGEKDNEFKRHVVAIDYAITNRYSDKTIRILIDDFLGYVEKKYFVDRNKTQARIVIFLADQRERRRK